MKVLIVDDEKDICSLVCKILKQVDIGCDAVNTIEMAKKYTRNKSYDYCFIDIKLPDGSGFDLITDIRKTNEDQRIVMISAFDGEKERERAKSLGVEDFISKPFTKKEILKAIY
jgi:two-component system response regulator PilR (NtrC family)